MLIEDPETPRLRKDAAANRERLLAAGRKLFALRGLDATLNDVAHEAGVGVGTAYRRFANKDELIDAILVRQAEELEAILDDALAKEDPWTGLVHYLEGSLAIQATDRAMAQIFSGRHARPQKYDWSRDRLAPKINQIADCAREAGLLRRDVTGTDLVLLQVALVGLATPTPAPRIDGREDLGELYRRYLWIALDGLRPQRGDVTDLPVPPLTTQQTHVLLGTVSDNAEPTGARGEPCPATTPTRTSPLRQHLR